MCFSGLNRVTRQANYNPYIYAQVIVLTQIYKFKHLSARNVRLDIQHSKNIWFQSPTNLLFKVYKHRLVLFGRKKTLTTFLAQMQALRPPSAYTTAGLRIKPSRYRVKPGKIRRK